MKKLFLIGVGFVLAVAFFGVAGFAYAQNLGSDSVQAQEPPEPQTPEGPEFPYGRAYWGRGSRGSMMGGETNDLPGGLMGLGLDGGETGLLHDYLWPAMTEAFGFTNDQIDAFEIVRETVQGIRENLTEDEIRANMTQAMTVAIENAQTDGAITEEQAEAWLVRFENMEEMPFGRRGKVGNFRQGFSRGLEFGRQMMVNHEYLDAAIAEMLEVSVEDLYEIKTEQGFNLKAYADEQGLSEDEFNALRIEILTDAVNLALEDGGITQEKANWVLEHLENIEDYGSWFDQP
jgi:hypothetical protein